MSRAMFTQCLIHPLFSNISKRLLEFGQYYAVLLVTMAYIYSMKRDVYLY
jgi:hypothetical protein